MYEPPTECTTNLPQLMYELILKKSSNKRCDIGYPEWHKAFGIFKGHFIS